ncbi:PH domain-containing protein [Methanobrevibacter sp. DSM 116169]|uniref:PH domain-containing protein n=1 Tax=Methanobrevibacter sp. DSM 116169 TaxID=3242727 RepID=UPI0038FC6633
MLSNEDTKIANEKIIYKAKPNFFFSLKKAIIVFFLLAFIMGSTSVIIESIGRLQVYIIERVKLPLTSYVVIAIVVIILILIFYIVWQILSWYSIEYTLTSERIIVKKGVLLRNKSFMPYSSIQDVSSSQSILGRLFSVGSVFAYSAYDNNQIILNNISKPSNVEDIIFNQLKRFRSSQNPYVSNNQYGNERVSYEENHPPYENGEYYPHDNYNRKEYYPEDNFQNNDVNYYNEQNENYNKAHNLFDDDFDNTMNEAMMNIDKNNMKFRHNDNRSGQSQYDDDRQFRHNDGRSTQSQYDDDRQFRHNDGRSTQSQYGDDRQFRHNDSRLNQSQYGDDRQFRHNDNRPYQNEDYNTQKHYYQEEDNRNLKENYSDKNEENDYSEYEDPNEDVLTRFSRKFKK